MGTVITGKTPSKPKKKTREQHRSEVKKAAGFAETRKKGLARLKKQGKR